jgi:HPt (histidine-containing phosphotransfer) domain-containing protein
MEKIVVTIDPDLEDIILQFMENTRKDVSTIACALSQNDPETIRRIAHSMKSYGTGYGFEFISQTGRAIEYAAVQQQWPEVQEHLNGLTRYLDEVKVVYG